jgi:uncharacterized protein
MELIFLGLIVGAAIGATGVGGGVLTAPALILFLGFGPRVAVATALIFSAVVKVFAGGMYFWRRNVDLRTLGRLLMGGLPGAIVGAAILERFRGPGSDTWVLVVVGGTVGLTAGWSLYRLARTRTVSRDRPNLLAIISFPIGFEVGFSSAGAGALGAVLLFSCTTLKPVMVVGTDLVFGMLISAAGGGIHVVGGSCDWTALSRLVPAGIIGAFAGAWAARSAPSRYLRMAVLAWALGLGVLLVRQGLAGK